MTVQEKINEKIKNGKKVNTIGIPQVESYISNEEFLEFQKFLSGIAVEKGRTSGTTADKRLSIISDWYHIGKGDIELQNFNGISVKDNRRFQKLVWTSVKYA